MQQTTSFDCDKMLPSPPNMCRRLVPPLALRLMLLFVTSLRWAHASNGGTCRSTKQQENSDVEFCAVDSGVSPDCIVASGQISQTTQDGGDFVVPKTMDIGQIEPIRWTSTGQRVTPNAYLIRMKPEIREMMLEYCDSMNITNKFRDLTYRGNSLGPDENDRVELQHGLNWYIQRPPSYWRSNMHWISPLDSYSHNDYLRALGKAGFDDVLVQIGNYFNLTGLACYHLSFIAVSHSQKGFIHYDMRIMTSKKLDRRVLWSMFE